MTIAGNDKRLDNLKPIDSKERAKELGSKGGKAKTPRKKMNTRTKCKPGCPYYSQCPLISLSQKLTEKDAGKCILKTKTLSPEVRNYFFNLFDSGEEGLVKSALDLQFRLLIAVNKNPSPKNLKDAIDTTIKIKESIYGKKTELTGELNANLTGDITLSAKPEWITQMEAEQELERNSRNNKRNPDPDAPAEHSG